LGARDHLRGAVTVVAGLQVKVAKGAALFSNGILVTWDDQNVNLTAANNANPRIDRLEIAYSLADGTTVTNIDNVVKVRDKNHVATPAAVAGVPAGVPAAPAKTAGNLTLALISVAANQVALGGGDINQTEDTARDLSYLLLGSLTNGVRFNSRLGVLQYTTDGATWNTFPASSWKLLTHADSPYPWTPASPRLACDTSGGAIVINLPAAASMPLDAYIAKITGDANTVTINPNGAEKIQDDNSQVLDQKFANLRLTPYSGGTFING
jgi:hypothetical protein